MGYWYWTGTARDDDQFATGSKCVAGDRLLDGDDELDLDLSLSNPSWPIALDLRFCSSTLLIISLSISLVRCLSSLSLSSTFCCSLLTIASFFDRFTSACNVAVASFAFLSAAILPDDNRGEPRVDLDERVARGRVSSSILLRDSEDENARR